MCPCVTKANNLRTHSSRLTKSLCQLVLQLRACAADTQRSTAGLAPAKRRRPLRPDVLSCLEPPERQSGRTY